MSDAPTKSSQVSSEPSDAELRELAQYWSRQDTRQDFVDLARGVLRLLQEKAELGHARCLEVYRDPANASMREAMVNAIEQRDAMLAVLEAADAYFKDDHFFGGLNPKWFKQQAAVRDTIDAARRLVPKETKK